MTSGPSEVFRGPRIPPMTAKRRSEVKGAEMTNVAVVASAGTGSTKDTSPETNHLETVAVALSVVPEDVQASYQGNTLVWTAERAGRTADSY